MQVAIERATPDDAPSILRLLSTSALPIDGVLDHIDTAIVARYGGRVVGCAALEVYAEGALLRSVAVDAAFKGRGLGTSLTLSVLDLAASIGSGPVFLLTTTAERFFPRFGFERTHRGHVPASVLNSLEFASACPASAIIMKRRVPA